VERRDGSGVFASGERGARLDAGRVMELAPKMARDALASGSPANNPRVPTEDESIERYRRAL
jgi:alcohol dehydrogenase class IV